MEEVRRAILGRDGILAKAFKGLKTLPVGDRLAVGTVLNNLRSQIREVLNSRGQTLNPAQPEEYQEGYRTIVEEFQRVGGVHPDPSRNYLNVPMQDRLDALKFLFDHLNPEWLEEEAQCLCQCSCIDKDSQ